MSLRKLTAGGAALAAFALSVILSPAASAQSQIDCTDKVVDQSSTNLDIAAVTTAIERVELHGADVYVRAFQTAPGGSMDAFWQNGLRICPNWRDSAGTIKDNVVFIGFSVQDRQSAIFYGGNFDELRSEVDGIRADDMGANFREGNFTEGVTDALDSIEATIDPLRPVSPGVDGVGIAKWFGLTIGFIALLVVAFFGVRGLAQLISRRLEYSDRKRRNQAAARRAKSNAASAVSAAPGADMLDPLFVVQTAGLPDELIAPRRTTLGDIKRVIASSSGDYSTLLINGMDPASPKLTADDYDSLRQDYGRIAIDLTQAAHDFNTLLEKVKGDKFMISPEGRARRLGVLSDNVDDLEAIVGECQSLFDVSAEQQKVADLRRQLKGSQALAEPGNDWALHCKLLEFEGRVQTVVGEFKDLTTDKATIISARRQLLDQVAKTRQQLRAFSYADVGKALRSLDSIESNLDRFVGVKLDKGNTRQVLLDRLRAEKDRIAKIAETAAAAEKKAMAKKQEEREAAARKARASHSSPSSSRSRTSGSDSSGGYTSGYVSGSYGSSGSSGSSSYGGSSSSDGGSSGGWSSSGGGFDGGSSGGW